MSHIVFFSYARESLDPYLLEFFNELCQEISPLVGWAADDERISFRDKNNLRLMENWQNDIEEALQTCTVLVCLTSVAYFNKEFCGKEYYIFDQRRRVGLVPGLEPPAVVLPVIWAPVSTGLPQYMNQVQQVPKHVSDAYRADGLRKLKRFNTKTYEICVTAFAEAIVDAWKKYEKKLKRPPDVKDFSQIPNHFADGDWQEAADSNGWLRGPEVANFVFAASSKDDIPQPAGRYGEHPSDWRPYLPPEPTTILEHAKKAAKSQSLKFREIRISTEQELDLELTRAKERKNLSVLLADPKALPLDCFKPVRALEKHWWEGSAMVLPCDDDQEFENGLKVAFPIISQTKTTKVQGPVRTAKDLDLALDLMLTELRTAVTHAETGKKTKTDEPPPGVTSGGSPSK